VALLAGLDPGVAAAPEIDAGSPQELLESLAQHEHEHGDAERDVELLTAATDRWPDDLELVKALAGAYDVLGRPEAAAGPFRDFAERHPDSEEAWIGAALAASGDDERLEEALGHLDERGRCWVLAVQAGERGDAATAADHAAKVVELDPEVLNARRLLAYAAMQQGDYSTSLDQLDALLERVPDEDLHWQRITVATAAGDEAAARASAEAVGMDLSGAWGPLRLSFGPREVLMGRRTGPATARVDTIAAPGERQRAGTTVIIDLTRMDDGGDDVPPVLNVREVLEEPAMRSFPYDAIDPGDDAWMPFREAIEAEGWMINSFLYRDDISIVVDGERRRALYGLIAVPENAPDETVHARLTDLAATLPAPMIWPRLARAAGDEATAAEQLAVAKATGLLPD
jgi:Flp pilus assembly protein TadD